jgi:uncharacterized protein YjiS (DUF1127 family)
MRIVMCRYANATGLSWRALICRPDFQHFVSYAEMRRAEAIGDGFIAAGRMFWRAPAAAIAALRQLGATIVAWRERARQRQMLLRLDYRALRDLGVTPLEAWNEGRKVFWRK